MDRRSIIQGVEVKELGNSGSFFDVFSEQFRIYMITGGMPGVVSTFLERGVFSAIRPRHDQISDGFVTDIRKYATGSTRTRAISCLDAVPRFLASENKKFVYRGIDDDTFGKGYDYYKDALEWLSKANIVIPCLNVLELRLPFERPGGGKSFKLYMMDTGVLLSKYGRELTPSVLFGEPEANLGAIAENAVAQALHSSGRRLHYFSTSNPRMEIDFVTTVNGEVCCIEVKSGSNRRCDSLNKAVRELGTLGIMFETRNIFVDDKGIRHYPLFAASFFDEIDHWEEPKDDSMGRIEALNGLLRTPDE